MSRIHEALKKAATERSAQLAGKSTSELARLVEGSLVEVALPEQAPGEEPKGLVDHVEPGCSGFEKLIGNCRRTEWKIDPRFSVFAGESMFPHGAEKFRTLRSRLHQIAATRPLKRVLVTSSVPAEGKTFIAANLAHSIMCQPDRRVLLIDADLRASRMHQLLGAPSGPGLTDYLRGKAEKDEVIQNGLEGNLCFIPSGSIVSNLSELLLGD